MARRTLAAPTCHRVLTAKDGHVIEESWQDRARMALIRHDLQGKLIWEWRYDGERRLEYVPFGIEREGGIVLPNAAYGVKIWRPEPSNRYGPVVEEFNSLLRASAKDVAPTPERVNGLDRYRFTRDFRGMREDGWATEEVRGDTLTMEVEPATKRIRSLHSEGLGTTVRIEYPKSIPDAAFDVARHEVQGAPIHDLDKERAQIDRTLRKGLGSKGGITLRFLGMDWQGSLWALWTGRKLDEGDPFKPTPWRLLGVKSRRGMTFSCFTEGWKWQPEHSHPLPAIGTRVSGTSIQPLEKIGRTVSIEIRSPSGKYERFSDVPVQRMMWFGDYEETFGWKKVGRSK